MRCLHIIHGATLVDTEVHTVTSFTALHSIRLTLEKTATFSVCTAPGFFVTTTIMMCVTTESLH